MLPLTSWVMLASLVLSPHCSMDGCAVNDSVIFGHHPEVVIKSELTPRPLGAVEGLLGCNQAVA